MIRRALLARKRLLLMTIFAMLSCWSSRPVKKPLSVIARPSSLSPISLVLALKRCSAASLYRPREEDAESGRPESRILLPKPEPRFPLRPSFGPTPPRRPARPPRRPARPPGPTPRPPHPHRRPCQSPLPHRPHRNPLSHCHPHHYTHIHK